MKLIIAFDNIFELKNKIIGLVSGFGLVPAGTDRGEAPELEAPEEAPEPRQDEEEEGPHPHDLLTKKQLQDVLTARDVAFNAKDTKKQLRKVLDDLFAGRLDPEVTNDTPPEEVRDQPSEEVQDQPDPGMPPIVEADLFGPEQPDVLTKEDVRILLVEYIEEEGKSGQEKAVAMLKKVSGVSRLADLKEEQYGDVVKALKDLQAGD